MLKGTGARQNWRTPVPFLREATSHKGELAHLCGDCRDPVERSGSGCAKQRAIKGELAHLCGNCRDQEERSEIYKNLSEQDKTCCLEIPVCVILKLSQANIWPVIKGGIYLDAAGYDSYSGFGQHG